MSVHSASGPDAIGSLYRPRAVELAGELDGHRRRLRPITRESARRITADVVRNPIGVVAGMDVRAWGTRPGLLMTGVAGRWVDREHRRRAGEAVPDQNDGARGPKGD